jgi:HEAT repeat protein
VLFVKSVAEALGEIGDARAVEALIEALKDRDSDVSDKSRDALVKIAKKDLGVVDKLIKALRDEDSYVRGGIAKVLGNLGWEPKSEEEIGFCISDSSGSIDRGVEG